jgi:hypothetical protein
MPQLIAMVIVVVAAMIYMFQTFGGTGDKIEGIAIKTSAISEINNIKTGLKLAARAEHLANGDANDPADAVSDFVGLSRIGYFQEQINNQLINAVGGANANIYRALSFGDNNDMLIRIVNNVEGAIPGIFVDFSQGGLAEQSASFLENQIANDLRGSATIDRSATTATAGAITGANNIAGRTPAANGNAGTDNDGIFIIYFNDFSPNEIVR